MQIARSSIAMPISTPIGQRLVNRICDYQKLTLRDYERHIAVTGLADLQR
jgi:hypothetical protein